MLLVDLLSNKYSLAMAPGFFRIYSHVGIMHALEESGLFNVYSAAGSSAGAMGAGFLGSGMSPSEMIEEILKIDRSMIWDAELDTFRAGLLKGELLHGIYERVMPTTDFSQCVIPCGMAAYDVYGMKTTLIMEGCVATAMRASACFPILFAPVYLDGKPHIDGGVFDRNGMMALPSIPDDGLKLIVNIVFEREDVSDHWEQLPQRFKDEGATLLTIVVNGLLFCGPQNMSEAGPASYQRSKEAMAKALKSCHLVLFGSKHYVCVLDASEDEAAGVKKRGDTVDYFDKELAADAESKVRGARNKRRRRSR